MHNIKTVLNILVIIITILTCCSLFKIDNKYYDNSMINNFNIIKKNNNKEEIGSIKISKLNINEKLYRIGSEENNVDKHITILKESIFPNKENSIVFIAAHSGTGEIAYFKDLDKLKPGDIVILELNNKHYTYSVKNYWEEKKNGYINVNKEESNQLILTTCSPNNMNKQLIVNCIEKESD